MSLYDRAYGLLGIQESRSSFRGGGRGGGSWRGNNLQGWANKDMEGSSSIANRNRRIFREQFQDKTREAYERDIRKQITNEMQGENSNTPLTDAQKEEREKRVNEELKDYDKDPEKQKAAGEKYRPDLSSSEQSRRRQNQEADQKDAAREAVRDYVKEQEESGKDYDGDGRWTHKDAEAARKEAKEKSEKDEEPQDNEQEAQTADKAAEKEAEANQDPNLTVQQQITQLQAAFNAHIANPSAHHTPYYA